VLERRERGNHYRQQNYTAAKPQQCCAQTAVVSGRGRYPVNADADENAGGKCVEQ